MSEKYYQKARKHEPENVRAALALGRMWYEQGAHSKAQKILMAILDADPAFISEALPILRACFEQGDEAGFIQFAQVCE